MAAFIQKGGILVPSRELDPIFVFVDETYLPDHSAFIQAAVVFTPQAYTDLIEPKCRELLERLGPDAKEFKASNLAKGNRAIYEQFLKRVTSVLGVTAERTPLRAVVSVDAVEPYAGEDYDFVNDVVKKALNEFGITEIPKCVSEFSRQMMWLCNHIPKIIPKGLANKLVLTFDNQHKYARELRSLIYEGQRDQSPSLGDLITSFANTLFQRELRPTIGAVRVENFDFLWSEKSFGIQAADLLANLTYNALRYENGFRDQKTKLKRDILYGFIPEAMSCSHLRSGLKRAENDITCVNPQLILTMQINPRG